MARPQKQGLDYFPHDTDASGDDKLEVMRTLYGNDGYAFYFIILEKIYRTEHIELDVSTTEILQILVRKVAVTQEKFNSMLETALKWHLFDPDVYNQRHVLTSNGAKRRAMVVIEKREQMRTAYEQKRVSGAETAQKSGVSGEFLDTKKSKVKKSKVKKSTKLLPGISPSWLLILSEFKDIGATPDYIEQIKTDFSNINLEEEAKKFVLWWGEGKRKLSRPKSAWRNWLTKSGERKGVSNGNKRFPVTYDSPEEIVRWHLARQAKVGNPMGGGSTEATGIQESKS